jgi:hypothetical protein
VTAAFANFLALSAAMLIITASAALAAWIIHQITKAEDK